MKIGPKCRDQKCIFAYNLWTFLFSLFGVSWVMPKQVVNLPTCWNRAVGCCQIAVVWGWFGCVSCGLFGENRTILELKQFFLLSLFDWIIPSLLNFLDLCTFAKVFCIPSVHSLCTHGSILYFFYFLLIKFPLPIKNKQSLTPKILGSAMDSQ